MSQEYPQFQPAQPAPAPKKKHTGRNVLLAIGAVFVLLIGISVAANGGSNSNQFAGGQSPAPSAAGTSKAPATTPTAEAPATPAAAETTEAEEPADDTTTIGKALTYKSGIVIKVVSAKTFTAGYAMGLEAGHKAVKVTWTIENKTGETLDLSLAGARLTYGADGTQAESVYTEGVGGQYPFEGSLSNGKKKTATSAFSVPKAGLSKVTVEVEPESGSQTAFFTGSVR